MECHEYLYVVFVMYRDSRIPCELRPGTDPPSESVLRLTLDRGYSHAIP
jgi:hypothetical protein